MNVSSCQDIPPTYRGSRGTPGVNQCLFVLLHQFLMQIIYYHHLVLRYHRLSSLNKPRDANR